MKRTFFLAHRYHRAHWKNYVMNRLGMILFITALLTSLLYRDGAFAALEEANLSRYGGYSSILYNVEEAQLQEHRQEIDASFSGVVTANFQVANNSSDIPVFIGTIDENALRLKNITLTEGRLPEKEGEAAVESSTLLALGLSAKLGQAITLPVWQSDGTQKEQTYQLTGIFTDYLSVWKRLDSSKASVASPPPGVVLGACSAAPLYSHVLCNGVRFPGDLGGQYAENYYLHAVDTEDYAAQKLYTDTIVIPLAFFFAIVSFFGIYSTAYTSLAAQQEYFRTLRYIGLSKRQGRLVILLQAAEALLIILLGSTACSLLACLAIRGLLNLWGTGFVLRFQPGSFLLAYLAAFLAVSAAYLIPMVSLFRSSPLATGLKRRIPRKRRDTLPRNLASMWHRAVKSQFRTQNLLSALMVAFCTLLAVFGVFFALFQPRIYYSNVAMGLYPDGEDYQMFVGAGTANSTNFFVSLPRNMGISSEDLKKLKETEGLQVNYAYINYMSSHFFLQKQGDASPYLNMLQEYGRAFPDNNTDAYDKVMAEAGGQPGDQLVEPYLFGYDYDSVLRLYPNLSDGTLDREKFLAGEEILGPDCICQVGDVFTMITPILLEGDPKKDESSHITFDIRQVRVGATFPSSNEADSLILSGEFITSLDPSARYEYLSIGNLYRENPAKSQQIDNLMTGIAVRSENVNIRNISAEKAAYLENCQTKLTGILLSLLLFTATVLLAFSIATYVKVRTSLHSYLLMRTIGASGKTVYRLLLHENWYSLFFGSLLGIAASLPFLRFYIRKFDYLPYGEILLYAVLPAFLATFLLLFLCSALAARKPVREILKRSLTEALSRDE